MIRLRADQDCALQDWHMHAGMEGSFSSVERTCTLYTLHSGLSPLSSAVCRQTFDMRPTCCADVMQFMGIVHEVGPNVKSVKKGDRVVACFDIGCAASSTLLSACTSLQAHKRKGVHPQAAFSSILHTACVVETAVLQKSAVKTSYEPVAQRLIDRQQCWQNQAGRRPTWRRSAWNSAHGCWQRPATDDRVRACACRCGQCFYCHHDAWSACSNTNPSKEEEALYGHRTAGFYGAAGRLASAGRTGLAGCCAHVCLQGGA